MGIKVALRYRRLHTSTMVNTIPSSEESMPVIVDVRSVASSESSKTRKRSSTLVYGPIIVRKRHSTAPTLATGRRASNTPSDRGAGHESETQRLKSREAARALKKRRDDITRELEATACDLEFAHRHLLSEVNDLQASKRRLEEQLRQVISPETPSERENLASRTSSPPWQLMFSIEV